MDEPGRGYAQAYVEAEKKRERNNSYISLAAEVGLTIGAIFTSGGLALLLAGLGTVVGVGNAAYELERADDLRSAANAGVAGSEFVDDPDAARFNYTMAWANLALAAVDVGITVREVSTAQQAFSSTLSPSGATAIAEMSPDQLARFSEVFGAGTTEDVSEAQRIFVRLSEDLGLSPVDTDALFAQISDWFRGGRQPQTATAGGPSLSQGEGLDVDAPMMQSQGLGSQGTSIPRPRWRASMSRDEAFEYVKDSVYRDRSFYHGTTVEGAENIASAGINPEFFDDYSTYGPGFYVAGDRESAIQYALQRFEETERIPAVPDIALDVRNPMVYQTADKFNQAQMSFFRQSDSLDVNVTIAFTEHLKNEGYDAIEIQDLGYFIVFEADQAVVFGREVLDEGL